MMAEAKLENVTSAFFSFPLHRREVKSSPTSGSGERNPSFIKATARCWEKQQRGLLLPW